jgi:hypothetical protein
MTVELAVLLLGVAISSFGAWFACLVVIRVLSFREDLFAIRDDLWDEMSRRNALDDPGHVRLRRTINAFIRIAATLSGPSVAFCANRPCVESPPLVGRDAEITAILLSYREKFQLRLFSYITRESLSGSIMYRHGTLFPCHEADVAEEGLGKREVRELRRSRRPDFDYGFVEGVAPLVTV